MIKQPITSRQQHWLDHVVAADQFEGSIVEYARTNELITKDIYQWKTALTKRGFLPLAKDAPLDDFVSLRSTERATLDSSERAHCRIRLPNGASIELFSPFDAVDIVPLLTALRSLK